MFMVAEKALPTRQGFFRLMTLQKVIALDGFLRIHVIERKRHGADRRNTCPDRIG
jgi:hypothetical protein